MYLNKFIKKIEMIYFFNKFIKKTHENCQKQRFWYKNHQFYPYFKLIIEKKSPSGGPPTGSRLKRRAASGGPLRGG